MPTACSPRCSGRRPVMRSIQSNSARRNGLFRRWKEPRATNVLSLTHEQLAAMLGVGRSYASRVIQIFKAQGILETRRGSILVRNREALRNRACLCNESVKGHFEEVLRGAYPTEETPTALKSAQPRR